VSNSLISTPPGHDKDFLTSISTQEYKVAAVYSNVQSSEEDLNSRTRSLNSHTGDNWDLEFNSFTSDRQVDDRH
jgi:hypothetical protein